MQPPFSQGQSPSAKPIEYKVLPDNFRRIEAWIDCILAKNYEGIIELIGNFHENNIIFTRQQKRYLVQLAGDNAETLELINLIRSDSEVMREEPNAIITLMVNGHVGPAQAPLSHNAFSTQVPAQGATPPVPQDLLNECLGRLRECIKEGRYIEEVFEILEDLNKHCKLQGRSLSNEVIKEIIGLAYNRDSYAGSMVERHFARPKEAETEAQKGTQAAAVGAPAIDVNAVIARLKDCILRANYDLVEENLSLLNNVGIRLSEKDREELINIALKVDGDIAELIIDGVSSKAQQPSAGALQQHGNPPNGKFALPIMHVFPGTPPSALAKADTAPLPANPYTDGTIDARAYDALQRLEQDPSFNGGLSKDDPSILLVNDYVVQVGFMKDGQKWMHLGMCCDEATHFDKVAFSVFSDGGKDSNESPFKQVVEAILHNLSKKIGTPEEDFACRHLGETLARIVKSEKRSVGGNAVVKVLSGKSKKPELITAQTAFSLERVKRKIFNEYRRQIRADHQLKEAGSRMLDFDIKAALQPKGHFMSP